MIGAPSGDVSKSTVFETTVFIPQNYNDSQLNADSATLRRTSLRWRESSRARFQFLTNGASQRILESRCFPVEVFSKRGIDQGLIGTLRVRCRRQHGDREEGADHGSVRYSSFRSFAVVEYDAIPNGFDKSISPGRKSISRFRVATSITGSSSIHA